MGKKIIELPDDTIKKLKLIAAHMDTDSKNYMQDLITIHVNKKYSQIMFWKREHVR